MICPACRLAGQYNTDAERAACEEPRTIARTRALVLHDACDNRCTCQHRVGQFIRESNA